MVEESLWFGPVSSLKCRNSNLNSGQECVKGGFRKLFDQKCSLVFVTKMVNVSIRL